MDMEKKYTGVGAVLLILMTPLVMAGMILMFIPLGLWSTWVELRLWHWFLMPYLGFRDISYWALYGVNIFIAQYQYKDHAKDRKTSMSSVFSIGIIGPAIALLFGWFVHAHLVK
jgi:hypothetical protein